MPTPSEQHLAASPNSVRCAVITVSDTRTLETDRGGALVMEMLEATGHQVVRREIVPDEPERMRPLIMAVSETENIEAVLLTGGTGISPRDQTYETLSCLLTKEIAGYGELFRMLSYEEIGASAMLSRTIGGLLGNTVVLSMPGSTAAVRLAMERLIIPQIGHLVYEARK